MKRSLLKYTIEGSVILLSILLSFYVEDIRQNKENREKKDQYLYDLSSTLESDLEQIDNLLKTLYRSTDLITEIQNDIDQGHTLFSDIDAVNKILDIEVGISFFPQDGIFDQMISTGSFELIKNMELKKLLLEMYNHQKDRNFATSTEIDQFNIRLRNEVLDQFRISFNYNSYDGAFYGSRSVNKYKFNQNYYLSNTFYGLLSQAKTYANMYTRLLKDIEKSYLTSLALAREEVKDYRE